MQETINKNNDSILFQTLAFFSLLYLGAAFPFSFFRHDDWLMIGNVARIIPTHWKFIFEPYLVFNSVPEVWFFRPWFKLILYFLYHSFGFHYYGWLALNLVFTLGTLLLGFYTIKDVTRDRLNGLIFVLFFVFSTHFHFASLVWVGEGTMNCPQIFLLFLNFYFFNKAFNEASKKSAAIFYVSGLLSFILSLGFKEAAIFHLPFLLLILFHPNQTHRWPFAKKVKLLAPYIVIASVYLFFRLYLLPFNPGYKPRGDLSWFLTPILYMLAALFLPLGAIAISCFRSSQSWLSDVKTILKSAGYLVFLLPFFITYMGHGFFSPGWLLAPGFYFALILGLFCPKPLRIPRVILASVILTFALSTSLVLYQTNALSWWSWYRPQRQILEIIKEVGNPQIEAVNVFNCNDSKLDSPHLHRVVGYADSIQEIFWLNHRKLPTVSVRPCSEIEAAIQTTKPRTLSLKWMFPEFIVLSAN